MDKLIWKDYDGYCYTIDISKCYENLPTSQRAVDVMKLIYSSDVYTRSQKIKQLKRQIRKSKNLLERKRLQQELDMVYKEQCAE